MRIFTYNCGYSIALLIGKRPRVRVFHVRLPFPVTLKSWRYLIRKWTRK